MIGRAIENLFYRAAVTGTHRALSEMGMLPTDATGTPAEQVRQAIVGPDVPAIEEGDTKPRGKRASQ